MRPLLFAVVGLAFILDVLKSFIGSAAEHQSPIKLCFTAHLGHVYSCHRGPPKFENAFALLGSARPGHSLPVKCVKWLPLGGQQAAFLHGACEGTKPDVHRPGSTVACNNVKRGSCWALKHAKGETVTRYAVNTRFLDTAKCTDSIKYDLSALANKNENPSGMTGDTTEGQGKLITQIFQGETEGSIEWALHALLVLLGMLNSWATKKGVSGDVINSGRRVLSNANELLAHYERAGNAVYMTGGADLIRLARDAWHIASYRLAAVSRIQKIAQQQSTLINTVVTLKAGESEMSELITLDILDLHRQRWEILEDVDRRVSGALFKEGGTAGEKRVAAHPFQTPNKLEKTSASHAQKLFIDSVASWDPDAILAEHRFSATDVNALLDALTKLGTRASFMSIIKQKFSAARETTLSRKQIESRLPQANSLSNEERFQPYTTEDVLDQKAICYSTEGGGIHGCCHELCSEVADCGNLPMEIVTPVQLLAKQRHLGCLLPTKSHNDIIEACLSFLKAKDPVEIGPTSCSRGSSLASLAESLVETSVNAESAQGAVEACSVAWHLFKVMTETGPFPNLETFELISGVIRKAAGIAVGELELAKVNDLDRRGNPQGVCSPRWYARAAETVAGKYFNSVVRGPLRAKATLLSRHCSNLDSLSEGNSGSLWRAYTPWVHGNAVFTAIAVNDYSAAIRIFDQLLHMLKNIRSVTGAENLTSKSYLQNDNNSPETCADGNAPLVDPIWQLEVPYSILKEVASAIHRLRLRGGVPSAGLMPAEEVETGSARRCLEGRAFRSLTGTTSQRLRYGWMHAASMAVAHRLQSAGGDKNINAVSRDKPVFQASQMSLQQLGMSRCVKELRDICHKLKKPARSVEQPDFPSGSQSHQDIASRHKEFSDTAALMRFPSSVWRSAIEYDISQNDPDGVQTILDAISQVQHRLPMLPGRILPSWLAISLMYFFGRFKYSRACMDTFNLVTSSWEAIYKQSQNRKEACSDFWLNSRDYLRKISQTLEALIRATGSSGRWRHGVEAIKHVISLRTTLFPSILSVSATNSEDWQRRTHDLHSVVAGSLHLLVDVLGRDTFPEVVDCLELLRTKFEKSVDLWCACRAKSSQISSRPGLGAPPEKSEHRAAKAKSSFDVLLEREASYEKLARGLSEVLSSFNEGEGNTELKLNLFLRILQRRRRNASRQAYVDLTKTAHTNKALPDTEGHIWTRSTAPSQKPPILLLGMKHCASTPDGSS